MTNDEKNGLQDITSAELTELFRFKKNPEGSTKAYLILLGIVLMPVTLIGAMLGYIRGYNRFMQPKGRMPDLSNLPAIVHLSMIIGAILIWIIGFVVLEVLYAVMRFFIGEGAFTSGMMLGFLTFNAIGTVLAFLFFRQWRTGMYILGKHKEKFGTARFAELMELAAYMRKPGLYIGGSYTFDDKGHILTVAGTRGGKGTNLIIPNLLGVGGYKGSWVVIDPKAENAAITARYQRESGNKVVVLNPWGLLEENIGYAQSYNPLDIVTDKTSLHLIDDIQIIAEMIVPVEKGQRDSFFSDNARSIVAGLLLHLVTSEKSPTLTTLWKWVRLPEKEWGDLLADMAASDDPANGEAVNRVAYEILKLQAAGDKTFGSIIATVLQCTDFLKSYALQQSLQSGFDPKELANGETTLYIIIPADKLQSHARWLRLVTITALRAVVRNPNKRVTFLLDEFAALGYLPEIENALSTYAGYNITIWPILQSLIQLNAIYGDIWETFIANATIRHFFSINDNFTANYVSAAMGQTSNVLYTKRWWGVSNPEANARALITPDELRRNSGKYIFAFMSDKPPTFYYKLPYYMMSELINKEGKARYDDNPYINVS